MKPFRPSSSPGELPVLTVEAPQKYEAAGLGACVPEQTGPLKVAVIVTHGMGQQIPFQTLDDATRGLVRALGDTSTGGDDVRAKTVRLGGHKLQRVEFDTVDPAGRDVEVHVYEGYWAPLAEGRITLRSIVYFLFAAAANGLRNSGKPFRRWMFGRSVEFSRNTRSGSALLFTAGVIGALIFLNAVIVAVASARIFNALSSPGVWPRTELLTVFTACISILCVIFSVFGLSLYASTRLKKQVANPQNRGWLIFNSLLQGYFYLLCTYLILSSLFMAAVLIIDLNSTALVNRLSEGLPDYLSTPMAWGIVWTTLFGLSGIVRRLLVQYFGDVVLYVSSHRLDQFMDVRQKIKKHVWDVFHAVYSAADESGALLYSRIGLLGHSLGSVVTYDMLNSVLIDDELNGGGLRAAERTKALVTFGSPLDKTAFIFGLQGSGTTDTREALAASVQPLIQDYATYRRLRWINIYSQRDPIGGPLDFYDDSEQGTKEQIVENIADPDALIPLVAHVEHWENPLVFSKLAEALQLVPAEHPVQRTGYP